MRRVVLPLAASILIGCPNNDAAPTSARSAAAPTAPAATNAATAVQAAPSAASPAPAPSASASASPAPSASAAAAAASPEPSADEWEKAAEVRVAGSTALGCETKRVREWVRVLCNKPNDAKGTPTEVKLAKAEIIRPGQPIVQTRKEVKLTSLAGTTSLVTRFVEGVDVEADFTWTDKTKHLSVFWPGGKAEPLYAGGFK